MSNTLALLSGVSVAAVKAFLPLALMPGLRRRTGGGGSTGYQIVRSLRFNSADSAYLTNTPASSGDRQKWTYSVWLKRGSLGVLQTLFSAGTSNTTDDQIRFDAADTLSLVLNGSSSGWLISNSVFRDASAWGHYVFAFDSTQGSAADRFKFWFNGSPITFSTSTAVTLNYSGKVNDSIAHAIGRRQSLASTYFSGLRADEHFVDGQALDADYFGGVDPLTGAWVAKAFEGTYGTNGFRLDYADNSNTTSTTLGKDRSGNDNDWTPNNFSISSGVANDSLVDVPSMYGTDTGAGGEVRGNYCTFNPVDVMSTDHVTLSNGNLDAVWASTTGYRVKKGTIGLDSGKWYWEITLNAAQGTMLGALKLGGALDNFVGGTADGYSVYSATGNKWNNNGQTAYGSTFTSGDVIGVALDLDNGKIFFSKNGTWQNSGDPAAGTNAAFTGLSGVFSPAVSDGTTTSTTSVTANFGQRPFAASAPSGFKAICSHNLSDPAVVFGRDHMGAFLWTGNGSTSRDIAHGMRFTPDLVIWKHRTTTYHWCVQDAVRGFSAGHKLSTNRTDNENEGGAVDSAGYINGVSATDISVTSTTSSVVHTNDNTATYVGYAFKEGATPGLDIVGYQGTGANRTISHGLGVTPKLMIVKALNSGTDRSWRVYHAEMNANPQNGSMYLDLTNGFTSEATAWNSTAPTSSVFSLGSGAFVNENGTDFIAYLFAEVPGFSRFGSYTGNGNAEGPFVWCGFRPEMVIVKRANSTGNWVVWDAAREPNNALAAEIPMNVNAAEGSTADVDFLSNGFKIRSSGAAWNTSGGLYVCMAFAKHPFKYAQAA